MAGVQGGVEVGWKFWVRGLKGVGGIGRVLSGWVG